MFQLSNDTDVDCRPLSPLQMSHVNSVTSNILLDDFRTSTPAVFDLASQCLSVNVSIFDIDVSDIPNIHTFVQNSISISAACGKWRAQTEVCFVDVLVHLSLIN